MSSSLPTKDGARSTEVCVEDEMRSLKRPRRLESNYRSVATLADVLARETREGDLYEALPDGRLRCYACGHCCPLPAGAIGVCKVRFNQGGRLRVPWGYVGGVQCDPIEKKPFFHAHPGALAYSFGMLGCDLHCAYCQNWVTSQALRDPSAVSPPLAASPEAIVRDALRLDARVVVSTYNEPLITSEWAAAIFKEAKAAGLMTAYVSNGNGTPQVLEYLRPLVDLYKVDLKSFDERHYRELGGRIAPILDTIRRLHEMDFWVEIVTLLIPGFNDSRDELTRLTSFVASVAPDIPWHVTAFHGDYRMTGPDNTTAEMLLAAAEIGRQSGLRHVYAGNLPGLVGDLENTRCAGCGEMLIERYGYLIRSYRITSEGGCPACGAAVPGRWGQFSRQIASRPFRPSSGRFTLLKM
jgi:pyruvate formate lyase activating enzyme